MEGNCTSGYRLAGSREEAAWRLGLGQELGGGRGRNQLPRAAGLHHASPRLLGPFFSSVPMGDPSASAWGVPSPVKVRTSPMSHPTAISPCILRAVYLKPASGGWDPPGPRGWARFSGDGGNLSPASGWCMPRPAFGSTGRKEIKNVFLCLCLPSCSGVGHMQDEP